jgi:hypothetical protein
MQAVNLASDLGDRIRANRSAGNAYAGNAADDDTTCTGTENCSPEEMAAHDLFVWRQQIAAMLPGNPTGTVTVDQTTNPTTYTITITWADPESGDDEDARLSYTMRLQI